MKLIVLENRLIIVVVKVICILYVIEVILLVESFIKVGFIGINVFINLSIGFILVNVFEIVKFLLVVILKLVNRCCICVGWFFDFNI